MTGRLFRRTMRFLSDPRGGVSAMLALMMIPLIGVFGMGAEASSWYLIQRAMQNTADSAAMAAASNGCAATATCHTTNLSATYADEATAVAKQFGFQNDAATAVATTKVNCPGGTTPDCYQVTITKKIAVHLVRVVGYNGDTTLAGSPAQTVVASAIARPRAAANTYCLFARGTAADAIRSNGGNRIDMAGCKVASWGGARCNGHDLNADEVDAVGTSNCAGPSGTNVTVPAAQKPADIYEALGSNIAALATSCIAPPSTFPSSLPAVRCYNGPVTIPAGVTTVTTPASGSVLVIKNGNLVINGTLQTALNSGLTIIFTGTSGTHILSGNGTLNIAAPTSGTWSGVAVYQDPSMLTGVNFSAAGNSPTWNITGLVYLPHSAVSFSGIVNKASNGHDCFALVVDTFLTNGTGQILEHQSECVQAGLQLPTGGPAVRQALVQ